MYAFDYFNDEEEDEEIITTKTEQERYKEDKEWLETQKV